MCKLWPMKTRTIIMMFTLVVAGLVIGCSSAPTKPVPVVPQILSAKHAFSNPEKAIAIARTAKHSSGVPFMCWATEPYVAPGDNGIASNFSHEVKARFSHDVNGPLWFDLEDMVGQPLEWMVDAKNSWTWEDKDNSEISEIRYQCTIFIWDATGTIYYTMIGPVSNLYGN